MPPKRLQNASNILMELRKICQHPYLSEPDMEDLNKPDEEQHKLLVDAAGKLLFLKSLLPQLKVRGHRVLLFSQAATVTVSNRSGSQSSVEDFLIGEDIKYLRLDGEVSQADRQSHIDKYNAADSDYFIFLLTTRAGGVGINLATADTVIIHDPDFNPHQDLQAIARSHRYGQTKRVLVFKLMTENSVEEQIINKGKKKMMLDHLVVQQMNKDSEEGEIDSLLLHGAEELSKADADGHSASDRYWTTGLIDDLIDGAEKEAEEESKRLMEREAAIAAGEIEVDNNEFMSFSFAKVWETTKGELQEVNDAEKAIEDQENAWQRLLEAADRDRESSALETNATSVNGEITRVRAARKDINYGTIQSQTDESPPQKNQTKGTGKSKNGKGGTAEDDSDPEFVAVLVEDSDSESDDSMEDLRDLHYSQQVDIGGTAAGGNKLTKHEKSLLRGYRATQATQTTVAGDPPMPKTISNAASNAVAPRSEHGQGSSPDLHVPSKVKDVRLQETKSEYRAKAARAVQQGARLAATLPDRPVDDIASGQADKIIQDKASGIHNGTGDVRSSAPNGHANGSSNEGHRSINHSANGSTDRSLPPLPQHTFPHKGHVAAPSVFVNPATGSPPLPVLFNAQISPDHRIATYIGRNILLRLFFHLQHSGIERLDLEWGKLSLIQLSPIQRRNIYITLARIADSVLTQQRQPAIFTTHESVSAVFYLIDSCQPILPAPSVLANMNGQVSRSQYLPAVPVPDVSGRFTSSANPVVPEAMGDKSTSQQAQRDSRATINHWPLSQPAPGPLLHPAAAPTFQISASPRMAQYANPSTQIEPKARTSASTEIRQQTGIPAENSARKTTIDLSASSRAVSSAQIAEPSALQLGNSSRFNLTPGMASAESQSCCYWCQEAHALRDCPSIVPEDELKYFRTMIMQSPEPEEDKRKGLEAISLMLEAHKERAQEAALREIRLSNGNATFKRKSSSNINIPVMLDDNDSEKEADGLASKRVKNNGHATTSMTYRPFKGCAICMSDLAHSAASCPIVKAGPDSIQNVLQRFQRDDPLYAVLNTLLRAQQTGMPTNKVPSCAFCGVPCGMSVRQCAEMRGSRTELKSKIRGLEAERSQFENTAKEVRTETRRMQDSGAAASIAGHHQMQILDHKLAEAVGSATAIRGHLDPLYAAYVQWPKPPK